MALSIRALAVACLVTPLLAAAADALPPTIFHSPGDDGVPPPGPVVVGSGGPRTLHLFMQTGPTASSNGVVCESGNGDEVCAVEGRISIDGGSTLQSFTPTGDVVFALTASQLRFNGGNPITGDLGAVKLGDLEIQATDPGSVALSQGASVSAGLALEALTPGTITTLPEPATPALIATSWLLLSAMRHWRRER
jgi:hypothetical protein